MIIYKATNKINGKCYVGKTIKTLNERIIRHLSYVNRGSKLYFHRAIRKYGKENFRWTILEICFTKKELNKKEQYYIKHFNSFGIGGYNMTEGGDGGQGFKHTDETKNKLSNLRKGKGHKHTEEHKKYMSDKMKGKNKRYGKDNHFYGKSHSEETKLKMSKIHKG